MSVPTWWQDAVCYQIYPRSFADSNGDGIGDLPGIIDKLDYLKWLGVDVLWISPFFPSPQFDVGYDVSNYVDVDPEYGTLADFDRLLAEAHQRGIKILLDLVLNHTSDQHEWFQQSKSSKGNPYRDWYVWHDGKNGGPPNDWESIFGGTAWEYDSATDQYYYHRFFKEQPDLNWRNPEVAEALFNAVRFWLDRGVDGFRLDAIGSMFEDEHLTDSGVEVPMIRIFLEWVTDIFDAESEDNLFLLKQRYQDDLPENHAVMKALRRVSDEYMDRVLLGETEDVLYYGKGGDELHSVFNFDLPRIAELDALRIRNSLAKRLPRIPENVWESNTIGNHDRSRSYTLYGRGDQDDLRYQAALAMTMFLQGTPTFYNGEEIGMRDYLMQTIEQFRDNLGVYIYHALQTELGKSKEDALALANVQGRDKCRTPMQWENAPNAGFSPDRVETWLPVNPDYTIGINVADQRDQPGSHLSYFRQITQLRKDEIALRRGSKELIESGKVLAFWRRYEGEEILVALNMSDQPDTVQAGGGKIRTLFSNVERSTASENIAAVTLAPFEVYVGKL